MIMVSRENFLHFDGDVWEKKEEPSFDITMGSFDGAETCELVGLFLLNEITNNLGIPQQQFGLYRDDGLMVLRASKRELDNLRKKLVGLFGKSY